MAANRKIVRLQEIYAPKDVTIPRKLGGGILKERVLGYDNSHGFSHRHFMGNITSDQFIGYEALYEKFELEWQQIAIDFVNGEIS